MSPSGESGKSQGLGGVVNARTIGFRAVLKYGAPIDEPRDAQRLSPGQAFEVIARRPASLAIRETPIRAEEASPNEFVHGCPFKPFGVFRSNGITQLELDPVTHHYISSPAASVLEKVWAPMGLPSILEPRVLFSAEPLRGCKRLGEDDAGQRPTETFYKRLSMHSGLATEMLLFVSSLSGLPSRLEILYRRRDQSPCLYFLVDFRDWRLDFDVSDATFDPTPPIDARSLDSFSRVKR